MSCFLYTTDSDNVNNIDIDDLYEKKQRRDLRQVSIFNKILNRIHKRITIAGRNKTTDQYVWFTVPEYIFGEPVYDKADCIAYIIAKLETNKFHIKYVHPNTLYVSWSNWIPSYVRSEYKKRTGISVNEFGQPTKSSNENPIAALNNDSNDINANILNTRIPADKVTKQYPSINQYKSTGSLVYNPDMFNSIEKKTS
jgi:hypothetical protein